MAIDALIQRDNKPQLGQGTASAGLRPAKPISQGSPPCSEGTRGAARVPTPEEAARREDLGPGSTEHKPRPPKTILASSLVVAILGALMEGPRGGPLLVDPRLSSAVGPGCRFSPPTLDAGDLSPRALPERGPSGFQFCGTRGVEHMWGTVVQ